MDLDIDKGGMSWYWYVIIGVFVLAIIFCLYRRRQRLQKEAHDHFRLAEDERGRKGSLKKPDNQYFADV